MSDLVSELPLGWCLATLEDVAIWSSGGTPSRANYNYYRGNIPWVKTGELGQPVILQTEENISIEAVNNSSAKIFPKNSVVMAMYGATIGKVSILGIDAATNQACAVGIPDAVTHMFLYYYLLSQTQKFIDAGKGGAQPNISQAIVKKWPIVVPPFNEQFRIVEKIEQLLSDLDGGVAELKIAQEKLIRYRQTLLKSAVEGSLTKEWREENEHKITETGEQLLARILKERRACWEKQKIEEFAGKGQTPPKDWKKKYPEPVVPDTGGLPELPEGWAWASVDQLVEIGTGVTPLKSRSDYYKGGNVPWITSGAVNDEVVTSSNSYITETALEECGLTTYPIGTLLVAMYGEGKTRGKCSELRIPATINQALAALVFNGVSEKIKDFIKIVLMNDYQKMRSRASGAAQPNLNLLIIRSLCVPLPSIEEQTAINNIFNQKKKEIDLQSLSIDSTEHMLNEQRKNILKDAFSGKLVEQNLNDEPALVLLKRIKFEREEQDKLPKQKKPKKVKEKSNFMKTLSEVLKANGDWMDAQEAFTACGVVNGTDTDRIEELYAELRRLDKAGDLLTKRKGHYDMIKLKDI